MFLDQVLQKQSLRKEFRAHDLWGGGGVLRRREMKESEWARGRS